MATSTTRTAAPYSRRRWTAVGTAGWHLAVVTSFDVVFDPDYVVEVVRDLLALEAAAAE
jgi:predicted dithiol-disulfide oxidoreductase (DUF899 family)